MNFSVTKALTALTPRKADWFSLRYMNTRSQICSVRNGHPEHIFSNLDTGVMIEVLVNDVFGYACTNNLSTTSLQAALLRAERDALAAQPFALNRFSQAQRPASKGEYKSPKERDGNLLDHIDLAVELSQKLKSHNAIVAGIADFTLETYNTEFVSSSGASVFQTATDTIVDLRATAANATDSQTRTLCGMRGHSKQAGIESFERNFLLENAERIREESIELLLSPQCPEGKKKVVIAPSQMMLQIHESIGHPLEMDRILGDERAYAGASFVKLDDFGKLQYGSPLLNVTFDPTISGEFASYGFDDIGDPAKKEFIIKDGVLVRALGGLESQLRSGIPGVANSRACSWNRAPIDRMANLNIEPGTSNFNDIIASIEDGIFMECNRSWSIDDYRNKFQFGCEYGKLIKNGKLTGTVKNPNYRGISVPFWNSLYMVGNASTMGVFGTPNCGKGEPNQCVRVGHASPVCAFCDIEIFGGL